MKLHSFTNSYHDGRIVGFKLDPKGELNLEIWLNPVWNRGGLISARLLFGGIKNYEEVSEYFEKLRSVKGRSCVAEIIGI